MGNDLPFDMFGILRNFLDSYRDIRREDVLVTEVISNALDAKATVINITFERKNLEGKNRNHYINFTNNARGMTEEEFRNYHCVSVSTKKKGEGIGFAGVGAKIYLGSEASSEIITATRSDNNVLASRMYRSDKRIQYETSMDVGLDQILGSIGKKPFKGTWYQVKLTEQNFYYLKNHIEGILQYWFNLALMSNIIKIFIGENKVEALEP